MLAPISAICSGTKEKLGAQIFTCIKTESRETFRDLTFLLLQSKDSVRGSGPRISQATLKALERKRKAK